MLHRGTARENFARALALAIVAVTIFAYANSFRGVFVFDDRGSILENASVRRLASAFRPPVSGTTVAGRPLLNASFAFNYWCGGDNPRGYHAVNLLIHIGAALALFGVLRRTLRQPGFGAGLAQSADWLGAAVAGLWAIHPLQTESVTYIAQRAESMAGLFYVLTLYCNLRSLEASGASRWKALGWFACALGMATKETMASAPLVVVLYDGCFVFGSLRTAWQRRRWWYVALGSTWVLLGWLVWQAQNRGGSAGFDAGLDGRSYLLTQARALATYGQLAVWPAPLVFDYGTGVVPGFGSVAVPAAGIALLLLAWVAAARRSRPVLFCGMALLALLAPTTLVPIGTQTMAEHRMYLPLAVLAALGAAGAHRVIGHRLLAVAVAAAIGWAVATQARNHVYASDLRLWTDTVAKVGDANARAQFNLGLLLSQAGRLPDAIPHYEAAVRLAPDYFEAQTNLGTGLVRLGRPADAIPPLQAAARLKPRLAPSHGNLGRALLAAGRFTEARLEYETALRLQPDDAEAQANLGTLLLQMGEATEALPHLQAALAATPQSYAAHYNLGNAWLALRRFADAIGAYRTAAGLNPRFADTHINCAVALGELGRWAEALAEYDAAARIDPHDAQLREAIRRLRLAHGSTTSSPTENVVPR